MTEAMEGEQFKQWYFFPDQCRHCISPPCKMVADNYDDQTILHDPETGAIIFTERTKNLDGEEIKMACPYDIPRWDKDTLVQRKCDMCIDRVQNGLLPACVLSCPTGTMQFGDSDEILAIATKRLEEVRKYRPNAALTDPRDVRVIFLCEDNPRQYSRYAVASLEIPVLTRKAMLAKSISPAKRLFG